VLLPHGCESAWLTRAHFCFGRRGAARREGRAAQPRYGNEAVAQAGTSPTRRPRCRAAGSCAGGSALRADAQPLELEEHPEAEAWRVPDVAQARSRWWAPRRRRAAVLSAVLSRRTIGGRARYCRGTRMAADGPLGASEKTLAPRRGHRTPRLVAPAALGRG
jgi:hypothetical protein